MFPYLLLLVIFAGRPDPAVVALSSPATASVAHPNPIAIFHPSPAAPPAGLTFPATHYYALHPGHSLEDLAWSRDSLTLTERGIGGILKKSVSYSIHSTEKRGEYILLFVKEETVTPKVLLPRPPYSLVVLSADKKSLRVLHEDQLRYSSLEECRKANRYTNFSVKYFFTYYPGPVYAAYLREPSIDQADSATMHHMIQQYVGDFTRQKDKLDHTKTLDPYWAGSRQDILSQMLIRYRFNPSADLSDMSKKMRQYHIQVPPPMIH